MREIIWILVWYLLWIILISVEGELILIFFPTAGSVYSCKVIEEAKICMKRVTANAEVGGDLCDCGSDFRLHMFIYEYVF